MPKREIASPTSSASFFAARASLPSSGISAISTVICLDPPLRHSSTATLLPGLVAATMRGKSLELFTGLPSNLRITSLASIPALSAGPFFSTLLISAPTGLLRPNDSASSRVNSWIVTPMRPRVTFPLVRNCSVTCVATSIGIAKDKPIEPPERV